MKPTVKTVPITEKTVTQSCVVSPSPMLKLRPLGVEAAKRKKIK